MSSDRLSDFSDSKAVSRLLDISAGSSNFWTDTELGTMLDHQLDSTIVSVIGASDPVSSLACHQVLRRFENEQLTFRQLFTHPQPNAELLLAVKQFAKSSIVSVDQPLPRPIALLLYNLSIAQSAAVHGRTVSSIEISEILKTLAWLETQDWLQAQVKAWIAQCRIALK